MTAMAAQGPSGHDYPVQRRDMPGDDPLLDEMAGA